MKTSLRHLIIPLAVAITLVAGRSATQAQTNVYVDPSKSWVGYMNVYDLSYAYMFGSAWGTADLDATFSGNILTMTPNTSIDRDVPYNTPYWWQDASGTSAGNKIMDANIYVQNDALAGQTVTFSGYCWANTLVSDYGSTTWVFVKDLAADFSSSTGTFVPLTGGGTFSVSLATTAGHHVQYGFEMQGPDARLATIASKGSIIVASNAAPAGPVITAVTPPTPVYVNVSSNVTLTATVSGGSGTVTYQWNKNGVNLTNGVNVSGATGTTLTLSNLTGAAEGGYSLVAKDSLNQSSTNTSTLVVFDPTNLSFDPSATLLGYVNANDTNHVYVSGFTYPPASLRGSVTNGVVLLQPNTQLYTDNVADTNWVTPDGVPNRYIEQDYFIQADNLAGRTVTFSGYCPSNSLDASYLAQVFIKDLASDYSTNLLVASNLVAGKTFSISRAATPGNHLQYGFALFGLDNAPTNVLTQGAALVSILLPTVSATRSGTNSSLTFPTVIGHNYTVQYKNNLTDGTWQTLSTVSGTGASLTVTDSTGVTQRFYRLSIQ